MFYTDVLLTKHGPLTKVWLAAHWEKKLTKDHVFECSIEKTIRKLVSPKVKFALRTSGYLLLGVVRIYKKKVKYLFEDCSEAVVKMNMAFRPGLIDLSKGELEASYSAITFKEEFYDFDTDNINSIDAPEYFTQNQSRPEEITLKEDYGGVSQILRGQSFEEENALPSCSVALSAHGTGSLSGEDSLMFNSGDGFGDEGAAEPTIDFLWNGDGNCLLEDMPLEEKLPLTPEPHQNTLNNSDGACFSSDDTCFPKTGQMDATTITAEQEGFSLPLVDVSGTSGTRKRKRRRLLIDPVKELSSQRICEQFTSCEDTLKAFEIAPPTRKLMLLKERNKASTLLSTPCQCLASDHLKKLFSNCLSSSALTPRRSMKRKLEEEDESCETHDISTMEEANSQEQLNLPPIQKHVTQVPKDLSSKNSKDLLNSKEDLLNSRKVPKAVRKNGTMCHVLATLQEYNKMGLRSFSLKELCKYNNPKEVAARFSSLLILAKKQVVELNQSSPYGDILVTVGPKFHDV